MKYPTLIATLVLLSSCGGERQTDYDSDIVTPHVSIEPPKEMRYNVISQFPHDTSAYTQGLELHEGKMYEGTGDYTNSSLRITDYKTGKVQNKHVMGSDKIFGEGISLFNDKIYQLTWQSHIVYVYDKKDISKPVQTFNWPYEGWGLTHDSTHLIISDGTANIYFVDPETFRINNTISVKDDQGPVNYLNELEYVDGFIYANVYETNFIVKIDAESGLVKGRLNCTGLLQPGDIVEDRTDVLNGIAFDKSTGNFLITGKRWPKMFEVKLD